MAANGQDALAATTAAAAAAQPLPPAIAPSAPSSTSTPTAPTSPQVESRCSTENVPVPSSNDDESCRDMAAKTEAAASPRHGGAGKRSSTHLSAFSRLPDEIIELILLAADPGSFASLILLNSTWRAVSQQPHLYAHHLARCPTYPASSTSTSQRQLAERPLDELRRSFARQVKRCRFDAYLRPSRTLVRLVSNTISFSSNPGGEGMQFQPSPRGHHLLAYNSSRIYVLDLQGKGTGPAVQVVRELKILRRPAATCIRDDASVLAVLLTEMQVDLYDLTTSPPRRIQSILLDSSPRAIALSPCGSVLAAAYEGGIEVSSLNADALPTDRRSVKCDHVDALAFSFDGTQLLGTSVHGAQPHTVILTAPYYDPGSSIMAMSSDNNNNNLSALWTTSILFPNTSRDCSHAVLLQDSSREEAFWTFTYDRSFETFRAVRIDDLRNGTTYFTGPVPTAASPARLLPCTLPSASYHGDLVAAAFQGKDIWLYGVPEDLDDVPTGSSNNNNNTGVELDAGAALGGTTTTAGSMSRANSGSPSMRAASARLQDTGNDSSSARVPQWQLLCDRQENSFIAGRCVGELPGVSMVNWVEGFGGSCLRERLVVGARGIGEPKPVAFDEDDMDFIDGGRLLLLDFDYGVTDGKTAEITIEVGTKEPEVLEEEHRDLAAEIAIVRRRTVAQNRGNKGRTGALVRNATVAGLLGGGGGVAGTSSMAPPPLPPLPSSSRRPPVSSSLRFAADDNAGVSDEDNNNDDNDNDDDDPLVPRRIGAPPASMRGRRRSNNQNGIPTPGTLPPLPEATRRAHTMGGEGSNDVDDVNDNDDDESASMLEEQMAYDAPYSHASPRSGMTLRRAATAAAMSRQRHPPAATTSTGAAITYRRADGRREHPHESDADNWVPPPPPYQEEVDPQDLPAFLRHNVPPVLAPVEPVVGAAAPAASTLLLSPSVAAAPPPPSVPAVGATLGVPGLPEVGSTTTTSTSSSRASSRPASRQSAAAPADDTYAADMYEATPPATPQPGAEGQQTEVQETPQLPQIPPVQPVQTQSEENEQQRPYTSYSALPSLNDDFADFGNFGMDWGRPSPAPAEPPQEPIAPKPITSVQTWPLRQPSVSARGSSSGPSTDTAAGPSLAIPGFAAPASGYPYSAPVLFEQPARPVVPPGPPSAGLPGVFAASVALPHAGFRVPRVPVGSYRPNKRPSTDPTQAHAQAQMQAQPSEPVFVQHYSLPLPQPPFCQPQPPPRAFSNPVMSSSSPLVEDQPLIISTPRGVTGAFDPPSRKKSARGGGYGHSSSRSLDLEEPKILAPVPRHANRHERNAELRERLETISGGGMPATRAPKPMINPFAVAAAATVPGAQQQQGLYRNASRAERSAARNMLAAKRRGWGRGKKDKGKGVDDGTATTVGASSVMSSVMSSMALGSRSRYAAAASGSSSQATAKPGRRQKGRRGGGGGDGSVVAPTTTTTRTASRHRMKRGGKKKKETRDVDAASSAWTDVTATTAMPGLSGPGPAVPGTAMYASSQPALSARFYGGMPSIPGGGPESSSAYAMQQLQQHMEQQRRQQRAQQQAEQRQAEQRPVQVHDAPVKKIGRCVVM